MSSFNHIAREVLSLEKSLNFYVNVLGKNNNNAGFPLYLFFVDNKINVSNTKVFKLYLDRHLIVTVTGCTDMGSVCI